MNTNDLNNVLDKEIKRLKEGKTDAKNLNAITFACRCIISNAKLTLRYNTIPPENRPEIEFFKTA